MYAPGKRRGVLGSEGVWQDRIEGSTVECTKTRRRRG